MTSESMEIRDRYERGCLWVRLGLVERVLANSNVAMASEWQRGVSSR